MKYDLKKSRREEAKGNVTNSFRSTGPGSHSAKDIITAMINRRRSVGRRGMERSGNLIDSVMKTSAAAATTRDSFRRAEINDSDVF